MKNPKIIIGCDPGAAGGIALNLNGEIIVMKINSLKTVYNFLNQFLDNFDVIVYLEKLHLYKSDSFKKERIFNIVEMMQNYSAIRTVFELLDVKIIDVYAQTWQKPYSFLIKNLDYTQRKRKLKNIAQGIFENEKVTLWNCDALLILEHGLRIEKFNEKII